MSVASRSQLLELPVRSLVVMHLGSNSGYAIEPLETSFHRVCERIGGDLSLPVHFAFRDLERGRPRSIPDGTPVIAFDRARATAQDRQRLRNYVTENEIQFALFFDAQPVDPVYRVLRSGGVKTILSYWGAPISSRQPIAKLLLKRLEVLISLSKLDGFVFESKAMADLAVWGRGVPQEMIDVIPLGIDIDRFTPTRTDYVYSALGLPRDKKIIVYAGHMEERKGVRSLVKAAIELLTVRNRRDVTFLLFGNKGRESDEYERLYSSMNLNDRILFGGYRDDLHLCFPGCFAGVIPSSGWDSFPRTSIELAASGLPLIVSRLGGLPECIDEGETGLIFPPGDHTALADRLEYLLDHPQEAERLGRNGRARCEREYTIPVQEERLVRCFSTRIARSM